MNEVSELTEVDGESLEGVENVSERIEQGLEQFKHEKFDSQEDRYESIAQGISAWLRERSEDARELANSAREMVKELDLEHPAAEKVLGGLERASELMEKGAEALKGEQAEGLIQLLALAFLVILKPEAGLEFISKNPELLTKALKLLGA